MQLNEQTIMTALQAVQDPDLHKNIVELNPLLGGYGLLPESPQRGSYRKR